MTRRLGPAVLLAIVSMVVCAPRASRGMGVPGDGWMRSIGGSGRGRAGSTLTDRDIRIWAAQIAIAQASLDAELAAATLENRSHVESDQEGARELIREYQKLFPDGAIERPEIAHRLVESDVIAEDVLAGSPRLHALAPYWTVLKVKPGTPEVEPHISATAAVQVIVNRLVLVLGHGDLTPSEDPRAAFAISSPHDPAVPKKGRTAASGTFTYYPLNRYNGKRRQGPADDDAEGLGTWTADFDLEHSLSNDLAVGITFPFQVAAHEPDDLVDVDGNRLNRETGICDIALHARWWLTQGLAAPLVDAGVQVEARLPTGDEGTWRYGGTALDKGVVRLDFMAATRPYSRTLPSFHARIGREWYFQSSPEMDFDVTELVFGMIWNRDTWRDMVNAGSSSFAHTKPSNLALWLDIVGSVHDQRMSELDDRTRVKQAWETRCGAGYLFVTGMDGKVPWRYIATGEIQRRLENAGLRSSLAFQWSFGLVR